MPSERAKYANINVFEAKALSCAMIGCWLRVALSRVLWHTYTVPKVIHILSFTCSTSRSKLGDSFGEFSIVSKNNMP